MSGHRRLVVVRHGRTSWNAAGRYQGQADVDLDDEGRQQAESLVEALTGIRVDLLVSSDLQRARHTAEPFARSVGVKVDTDPRLREVDVGAWEGLTPDEAAERFPEQYAAWRAGKDVARGAGETRKAAGERAVAAILEHGGAIAPGGTLVVVSHGMVLRTALRRLRADGAVLLDEDPPHLGNAAWLDVPLVV